MNETISNALTQESPGKVMALLGTAMFSLAFLFAVVSTDSSFSGTSVAVNDPFSIENVVATIDSAAASYDKFLYANLFQPAEETYALYSDNLAWLADNSGLTYALGFNDTKAVSQTTGQVAGATTYKYQQSNTGLLDVIYQVLTQ
jgi:hypothetical protein